MSEDKGATVSESIRSLITNELMWAIRSGPSGQKSEWANHYFFLSESLIFLFPLQKTSDLLNKINFFVRIYSFF